MTVTGGCLCKAVRYSIEAEPVGARMCWCRDCQHIASGSATVNVLFPADAVKIEGDIRWFEKTADSGNRVKRGFCSTCGAQLFSVSITNASQPTRVRSGTLDNPDLLAPQAIIWAASAPSWAKLDPDLPHFPGQPPAAPPKSG